MSGSAHASQETADSGYCRLTCGTRILVGRGSLNREHMFCSKCGRQVEQAAKFCRQCGAGIGGAVATVGPVSASAGPKLLALTRLLKELNREDASNQVTGVKRPDETAPNHSRTAGWIIVFFGVATMLVPSQIAPLEALILPTSAALWVGFSLVFSGSAIIRIGSGFIGAVVVAFALFHFRDVAGESGRAAPTAVTVNEVALDALLSDYTANEVAADQRYKGRLIRIRGVLKEVNKDILNAPFVVVGNGSDVALRDLQCALSQSAGEEAAGLTRGEPITVQGRVSGLRLNVQLTDCTVVTGPGGAGIFAPAVISTAVPAMIRPAAPAVIPVAIAAKNVDSPRGGNDTVAFSSIAPDASGEQCAPKSTGAQVVKSPDPNDTNPDWTGSYLGTSWTLVVENTITSDAGTVYKSGHLVSPRGGHQPEMVFVIASEWECGR
jgi:putative nucleic acid binding protein/zinc ribbon protein